MLSMTSKYALRVLVALADDPDGGFVLGSELARRSSIPANYLSKILLLLRNAGMIETIRGHGGGYRLRRPPDEIWLIEVVEIFEGVRTHPSCILGIQEDCSDNAPCSAHASFREVRQAYIGFLETTSIADAARLDSRARRLKKKAASVAGVRKPVSRSSRR
jgi:Rrf2 family protein